MASEKHEFEPGQSEALAQAAERALVMHLAASAQRARAKYTAFDEPTLELLLNDSECVRYPTRIEFGTAQLAPHQFAQPEPDPEDPARRARVLHLHPRLRSQPDLLSLAVSYMIPVINYGTEIVGDAHCARYGSALLGMEEDEYYRSVLAMADRLALEPRLPDTPSG